MEDHFYPSYALSVPVSLTRGGYPRILPRFHRLLIYKRDDRANRLVKMYFTFFSFYSIIEIGKKLSKSTFKSIKSPVEDIDLVLQWLGKAKSSFPLLLKRYVPRIHLIPLHQGMRWIPSWKVLPTYHTLKLLFTKIFPEKRRYLKIRSPFIVQTMELSAFLPLKNFINARGEQWCQGILFPKRVRYAFDKNNKIFSGTDLDSFESMVAPYLPPWHPSLGIPMTGKLAQKVEGGGKRRIFAIGNWVNQRLLTPVHDWLSQILRSINMDGTYNQTKPLLGSMNCYCFDLTAATDRWPLVVMFEVMVILFDRSFASAVVNSALAMNIFYKTFIKDSRMNRPASWISFVAGQPLGYRSSWALFALTHHLVVWYSAEQVYPGKRFDRYAILGDDIVIADRQVAEVYKSVLQYLQVKISGSKSLISKTGGVEFAKRFLVKGLSVDLSPVTIKSLLGAHLPMCRFALAHRYPIGRFSTFRRLGGAGYKSCSRTKGSFTTDREKVDWCLWVQLHFPSLESFFGDGYPLPPWKFWWLVRRFVKAYAPDKMKVPDDNVFVSDDQRTFQEYTAMYNWVEEWLGYYAWWLSYYRLVNNYLDYRNMTVKAWINRVTL